MPIEIAEKSQGFQLCRTDRIVGEYAPKATILSLSLSLSFSLEILANWR